MAKISIRGLQKRFGATLSVADFSLEIDDGELVTFLGPSGCGKTTTLRMIAGFIEPTAGSIHIDGRDITPLPAHKRNTGMVFQRYALFPHMTVAQNVNFGLQMHKVPDAERGARVTRALDMVRMDSFASRYPRQLSGGQQQRVAVARALAIEPSVFLLDEPLSNLDAKLRVEVREEIGALQRRLGLTTIFVTHDQDEALAISDRMAIMHDGRVQQVGTPTEVYERPANMFVADFLGKMNFIEGVPEAHDRFVMRTGTSLAVREASNGTTHIGVRPERLRIGVQPTSANALPCTVESTIYLGSQVEVNVRLDSGERMVGQVPNRGQDDIAGITPQARAFACFGSDDCVMLTP